MARYKLLIVFSDTRPISIYRLIAATSKIKISVSGFWFPTSSICQKNCPLPLLDQLSIRTELKAVCAKHDINFTKGYIV